MLVETARDATACSCPVLPPAEHRIAMHDAAFLGRAVSTRAVLERSERWTSDEWTFEVLRTYKGRSARPWSS